MAAPNATCAIHVGAVASFACPRCGDFACEQCVHRVHPQSPPMCGTCWSKRSERVQELTKDERQYPPKVALWLGIASLIPGLWPAQVAGFIYSLYLLNKMKTDPQRAGRTSCLVGLVLSTIGLGFSIIIFVAMA